jgi:hypothetical protein
MWVYIGGLHHDDVQSWFVGAETIPVLTLYEIRRAYKAA